MDESYNVEQKKTNEFIPCESILYNVQKWTKVVIYGDTG